MAKGVILKTNTGIMLKGTTQCSNGAWWNANNCFKYCNGSEKEVLSAREKQHQAFKLQASATSLNVRQKGDEKWYLKRENFEDVEIAYEVDQSYKYEV